MRKFFVTIALVAAGLFLSWGYAATAQVRPAPAPITRPAPAQNSQINPIDQQFFIEAGQAGLGNIMLGQLALERASSDEVKQFAQAEIDEQTQVKQNLARIAPSLGLTPPTAPAPKFQAAMALLSQLSGDRFDQAYMDEGGINAHLENAALFQREAAFGQNPDLVALANQGLPIIERHFSTASALTDYRFAQVSRRFNSVSSEAYGPRSQPVQ